MEIGTVYWLEHCVGKRATIINCVLFYSVFHKIKQNSS